MFFIIVEDSNEPLQVKYVSFVLVKIRIKINIMNKKGLSNRLAKRMSITPQEAATFVKAFQEELAGILKEDNCLTLKDFGVFSLWGQTERLGRNPKTGDTCMIAPRFSVKFKPGKRLLSQLNTK